MQASEKTSDNTESLDEPLNAATLVDIWCRRLFDDDRSANTVRLYRTSVLDFLRWYQREEGSWLELDELTPIALVGYRNELQHQQLKATSTVNTRVAALRAWCAWLSEQGYLNTNPAARLKSIGRQSVPGPQGLSDRQSNALLREAQRTRYAQRDYALLQMLLQTGMRAGECAALNIEDIVFGERSGLVTIRGGKGNKARVVPLNGSARQALAEYVSMLFGVEPTIKAVAPVWPQRQATTSPTPLWRSQKRGRLSTAALRRMIDQLVHNCSKRRLVPEDVSAHTLRHTFAMQYLKDNPGDLIGLANLLGHTSLDTTQIYGQPTAEQLAARVDRLSINAYGNT